MTKQVSVAVVSDNVETLDGLCEYLRRSGVAAVGTRSWNDPVVQQARAVVGFPDDFETEGTLEAVARLSRIRPTQLQVLVTRQPKTFEPLSKLRTSRAPIVIPKPAWGWSILDALRVQLEA